MSKYEPLAELVDQDKCWCLNENPSSTHKNLFMGDDQLTLKSNDGDDDEERQLLINIQFREVVKLGAINLVAPQNDSAPSEIKIFINQPGMGFAEAEAAECVQELSLAPEDLTSNSLTMLNFLKFQGVLSVQIFVESNKGGNFTALSQLQFFGKTNERVNMSEFKRVGG
jgi:hypothetical protein